MRRHHQRGIDRCGRSRALVTAAAGALVLGACTSPATEVLVTLGTDAPTGQMLTVLTTVDVANGSSHATASHTFVRGGTIGRDTLPGTFAVTPGTSAPDATVTLTLAADLAGSGDAPERTFLRVARFSFTPHTTLALSIYLTLACANEATGCTSASGSRCTISTYCQDMGQTCGDDGRCTPLDVRPMPPGSVGGFDASTADAPLDAARDVGAADTAPVDSGRVDAPPVDAPSSDDAPDDTVPVDAAPDDVPVVEPAAFGFMDQLGAMAGHTITSDTVVLTGGFAHQAASCGAGCTALSINGGAFSAGPALDVSSGDTIAIRQLASMDAGATTTASVVVGTTRSRPWSVTTACNDVQVFTHSATWSRPACGMTAMTTIECWGGGGGGGHGDGSGGADGGGGGGGGSGGHGMYVVPTGLLPSTIAVTVGAGGAGDRGACDSGSMGGAGGSSSFGSYASAAGGAGGRPCQWTDSSGNGGGAGGAPGGNDGSAGQNGPGGFWGGTGGQGGGTSLGAGGSGGSPGGSGSGANTPPAGAGADGAANTGAGGGGGGGGGNGDGGHGGDGGSGKCVVTTVG